jgi:hypothetical protein
MASERLPRVVRRGINLRSLLAPFVVFAASVMTLAAAPRAAEAVADLCPNCGIIAAPVYVNVYWDTSPAQWTYDIMPGQPGTDGSSLQDTISEAGPVPWILSHWHRKSPPWQSHPRSTRLSSGRESSS